MERKKKLSILENIFTGAGFLGVLSIIACTWTENTTLQYLLGFSGGTAVVLAFPIMYKLHRLRQEQSYQDL